MRYKILDLRTGEYLYNASSGKLRPPDRICESKEDSEYYINHILHSGCFNLKGHAASIIKQFFEIIEIEE